KEGEHSLSGWPVILAWLDAHGFRNREGRAVNERTARGWSKRLGCPIWRGCRAFASRTRSTPPWTSNYLLLAWAVSLYRSGGPDARRARYSRALLRLRPGLRRQSLTSGLRLDDALSSPKGSRP